MIWAFGVMASRLMLGMHWPRDLAMAIVISWLLVTLASWLTQRWFGPLTIPAGAAGNRRAGTRAVIFRCLFRHLQSALSLPAFQMPAQP